MNLVEPSPLAGLVLKYSEQDFQQILQTVQATLKPRDFDKSKKQSLKSYQSDVYRNKSDMECYNFIYLYENYFTIFGTYSYNWVFFAMDYLKDSAMNR